MDRPLTLQERGMLALIATFPDQTATAKAVYKETAECSATVYRLLEKLVLMGFLEKIKAEVEGERLQKPSYKIVETGEKNGRKNELY